MILSILIPYVEKHKQCLKELLLELDKQTDKYPGLVQILIDDNEYDSTGKKRNRLLHGAKGEYVASIDADDYVFPYYVDEIIKGYETGADCMSIEGFMTTDGKNKIGFELSKDYENQTVKRNGVPFFLRKTNHITPVRRSLALQIGFPDLSNAEDKWYSDRLNPLLKTEHKIIPVMYHYRFSRFNKTYK